ncbi:MAG TPA: helix-turn-helix transcriptional regulator [Pseudolysinimonas sp.]|nr:helix-turn-helix transcriptional regulator [Pseudolysinimonas sp.]
MNSGQEPVRAVPFSLPEPGPEIELNTLRGIFRRGGRREFLTPQRLAFDMLYRLDAGETIHQVDFTPHHLGPGDMLWLRAGQVHRWGEIGDLEGSVVMFPSHLTDPHAREMSIRPDAHRKSSWSSVELVRSGVAAAWEALFAPESEAMGAALRGHLRHAGLSAVLLRLGSASDDEPTNPADAHDEIFGWFLAEVEARFRTTHRVSEYARRLGYSPKTLTRAASIRGTTPKRVIDDRIILEAQRLLVFTARSVADLGAEMGFEDASNFSSFFRQRTGMTPKHFRELADVRER